MYKQGERIFYCSHGVCEIVDIEQRRIDKKNIEYYVLAPLSNPKARFYVPTQNPKALSKLSPLMSGSELQQIILEQANGRDAWIEEENARKQKLKDVIASSDQSELIQWVRTLHIHRKALLENGKKFHQSDESFLKDAEKILITEFAIVFDISEDEVMQYVQSLVSA